MFASVFYTHTHTHLSWRFFYAERFSVFMIQTLNFLEREKQVRPKGIQIQNHGKQYLSFKIFAVSFKYFFSVLFLNIGQNMDHEWSCIRTILRTCEITPRKKQNVLFLHNVEFSWTGIFVSLRGAVNRIGFTLGFSNHLTHYYPE